MNNKPKNRLRIQFQKISNTLITIPFVVWIRATFIKNISRKTIIFSHEENGRYRDLAPVDNLPNNNAYVEALDWALRNKRINNIGISGPYGSGKSSVIASYCNLHPELNHIKISMADFKSSEPKNPTSIESEESLEAAFLKQLFYKVGFRTIPQSRYHKLHKSSKWRILLTILMSVIFLLGVFLFFFKDTANSILESVKKSWNISDNYIVYMIFCFFFSCLVFVLYRLVLRFSNKINIKEIKIDIVEAKNEAEEKESIFDKNLDEIVYFFEATRYKVVFIEDLDRFDNPSIFVKLRNLNFILNSYKDIKRRIVFVYAIKDDIFINNDRTKFFDYLIPIIPIINSTNSNEKLIEIIEADRKKGNRIDIDDDYIDYVSVYISDMRVLINSYNEFILYKQALDESHSLNIKDKNLFSILLFKNTYPVDFSHIQNEEGIIKKAFEYKKTFVNSQRASIEEDIESLANTIEQMEVDRLNDIKELKTLLLSEFIGYAGAFLYLTMQRQTYYFEDIMKDDYDIQQLDGQSVTIIYNTKSGNKNKTIQVNLSDYMVQYEYLNKSKEKTKTEYQEKIKNLQSDINELSALSLAQLIDKYTLESVLGNAVTKNKLLAFLLRNGYIDEDYPNYINVFHANSITQNDMNFILSVRNHEAMDFGYTLTKKKQVIKRLNEIEFFQPEVYNYDLVNELLSISSDFEYINKRKKLFQRLAIADNISLEFIEGCRVSLPRFNLFIAELSHYWNGLWDYVYECQELTDEVKDKYYRTICSYATIEDIKQMNKQKNIKKYFESNKDVFQRLYDVNDENLKSIIIECDIVFCSINYSSNKAELLYWVFNNGYYSITPDTINLRFDLANTSSMEMLKTQIYTSIIRIEDKVLIEKIDNDPDFFIENVVLFFDENINETIESVLTLISKSVNTENMCNLIEKEEVLLNNLSDCDYDYSVDILTPVWQKWLSTNKVKSTWENIITYYSKIGFDIVLQQFLEQNITKNNLPINEGVSFDDCFSRDIIISNIQNDVLEKLIPLLSTETTIEIKQIRNENLKLLIIHDYFEIDQNFINNLTEYHPNLFADTLILYHKEIIDNKLTYEIKNGDDARIIESKRLNDQEKINIICSSTNYSLSNQSLLFFRKYEKRLPETLFWKTWEGLSRDLKYQLIINQLTYLKLDDISKCFTDLDDVYKGLSNRDWRHKEYLSVSDYNLALLNGLMKKGYISSYKHLPPNEINEERYECWVRKKD